MELLEFGLTAETFSVNQERRTMTGLVVPWNKVSSVNQGRRFRFARGSIKCVDAKFVRFLEDHSHALRLGRAIRMEDTEAGLVMTFRVAEGKRGDQALARGLDGSKTGLSVGVEFDPADIEPDPENPGAYLVNLANCGEVSLVRDPSFDDSRLISVQASRDEGEPMSDNATPEPLAPAAPAAVPDPTFDMDALATAIAAKFAKPAERPVINPTRSIAVVDEPVPYRFDRGGNFVPTEHTFSADLLEMSRVNDQYGDRSEAGKRVMGLIQSAFADTRTTDVADLNPTIQRPDMYVDQRDYRTPLWNAVNKGALPNGVQPFRFPKFSAAAGLVGDHTEGVEPTSGSFDATGQTVTPTALSGKASVTREVWDMGGSPQVSTLIFNQMLRSWREGLENATATFLNTLTAATDIDLGIAPTDAAFITAWEGALTDLQFIRGYDFDTFAAEKWLYKKFAGAKYATSGEPAYPMINPSNRNGTAATRYTTLDAGGVTVIPTWALTAVSGSANNSWLFDPTTVHGWATAPQRLEFPGTKPTDGTYAPVAWVDIAIWGYKAFANSDIGGVRQVIFDNA